MTFGFPRKNDATHIICFMEVCLFNICHWNLSTHTVVQHDIYIRLCSCHYITNGTGGTWTAYPSKEIDFTSGFLVICIPQSLVFSIMCFGPLRVFFFWSCIVCSSICGSQLPIGVCDFFLIATRRIWEQRCSCKTRHCNR